MAGNFPPFSLNPEPPAARGGAECGGGQPRHPPSGECKIRLVTGTNPEEKIPMSNDTQLTITGNLVDDSEPRHAPNGQPAVRFRIASTPRFYDKAGESAGCPARARSRSPRRADLAGPNITQVRRPRSPTPCHDQFWAAKITRAGSGGHSHGSALNALPPGQVYGPTPAKPPPRSTSSVRLSSSRKELMQHAIRRIRRRPTPASAWEEHGTRCRSRH